MNTYRYSMRYALVYALGWGVIAYGLCVWIGA